MRRSLFWGSPGDLTVEEAKGIFFTSGAAGKQKRRLTQTTASQI
jgi:hypothetical protein